MNLMLEIDDTVNAGYVYFRLDRRPVDHTDELDDRRLVDYDEHGNPLGIEFLGIRNGVDLRRLPQQVEPYHDALAALLERNHIPVYA
jgi:uncharacterized protein YuzE